MRKLHHKWRVPTHHQRNKLVRLQTSQHLHRRCRPYRSRRVVEPERMHKSLVGRNLSHSRRRLAVISDTASHVLYSGTYHWCKCPLRQLRIHQSRYMMFLHQYRSHSYRRCLQDTGSRFGTPHLVREVSLVCTGWICIVLNGET
jgi:hypothetical protein